MTETHKNHHCVDYTISVYDFTEASEDKILSINLLENNDNNIMFGEESDADDNDVTTEKIEAKLRFNKF